MTTKQTPALNLIREVLQSHGSSYWLTNALKSAELRDPVDALRDAETLVHIFKMRWDEIANEALESVTS
jgi:hypothetical protein